jgi:hypothetical protein
MSVGSLLLEEHAMVFEILFVSAVLQSLQKTHGWMFTDIHSGTVSSDERVNFGLIVSRDSIMTCKTYEAPPHRC